MSAARFTERDVAKAVAGAIKGGLEVGRVEIDRNGRIAIYAAAHDAEPPDEIQAWLREHGDD